jgi:hypothetical protein
MQRDHKEYMGQIVLFQDKLEDTQAQLSTVQQDLNANISFAPLEGTLEDDELVAQIKSLNAKIKTVSRGILSRLPRELLERHFSGFLKSDDSRLFDQEETEFLIFADRLGKRKALTYAHVLMPLLRYTLCKDLHSGVLRGFIPSLDNEDKASFLDELYKSIQRSETQEHEARWRAISYTHVERNPETMLKLVNRSLEGISSLAQKLLATPNDLASDEQSRVDLQALFIDAATFWESAQTRCTKFDIQILGPPYFTKVPEGWSMEPQREKRLNTDRHIMTIEMGLCGVRTVDDTDGKFRRERRLLLPMTMLGSNWGNG